VPSNTVYWTGLGSPQDNDPNWSNPGNWSAKQVPQAGDTVVFTQRYSHESTTTVDAGFTAANVTLAVDNTWGGTINLAQPLTLTGDSQWSGTTTINLAGHNLTNDGTLTVNTLSAWAQLLGNDFFEGGNDYNLGGTLVNRGTIVQEGGSNFQLADNVQIANQAGATYDFVSDGNIIGGQADAHLVMSNAGTVEKTGGTGTSSITVAFSNLNGTLAADSGTLQLASGYLGGASTGGTFDAAKGAVLDLTGGGGALSTNTGVVRVQSGTLQFPNGLPLNGAAALTGSAGGTLSVRGDVLGNTTRAGYFAPLNTVVLAGTLAGPAQLLEVMSQDRGDAARGFVNNFAYGGTLEVAAGKEVRLVDRARNSPGRAPEALYVDTLVVPPTATLDLNGHHVYVRSAQVKGTVVGGTIRVLPPALTAAGQEQISATAGQAFSGAVAAVTDTFRGVTAGRLRAAIAWGDGQASAGTVSANADGTFGVSGTHTYARPGSYGLSVAVLDTANRKAATARDTATVQPAGAPPFVPFFLVLRRVRAGAVVRLVAEVSFTGGLPPLGLAVPYQAPVYQHVAAALGDLDGDGILDAVLFTARQGWRHVRKVVPV
jgi:hypothetical protein